MAPERLTTLARVKAWLNVPNTNSDVLLGRLIANASLVVVNFCNRQGFGWRSGVTEVYDGPTGPFLPLRQWPVTAVASLSQNGSVLDASLYELDPPANTGGNQRVVLKNGCNFYPGRSNVSVTYATGFRQDEAATVPAAASPAGAYEVETSYCWVSDLGVTLANGSALTKTTGAPASGQYAVSSEGVYTFNAAQAGASVVIAYGNVPPDVEQVVTELVGERYRRRDRIGMRTQAVNGNETAGYESGALTDFEKAALQNYRLVTF